jgi:hypothetical protein
VTASSSVPADTGLPRRFTLLHAGSLVNRRIEVVLSEQAAALESGALILVEDARYRIRRLPIRG